ncbi:MAG: PD40 domain-containing protein [Anaeromyxobacter sp.]|nr:PD40 domain-containing protein [Anaeromyxobacter sp.]MBL0277910.1 PD40 domain-containing protein [Anaeromyxobacter sp.]
MHQARPTSASAAPRVTDRRLLRPLARLVAAALLLGAAPTWTPAAPAAAPAADDQARLLRFPDVSGDTIAFSHGGDLWTVPAAGGLARRLTSAEGLEVFPRFSPDGRFIAFTGQLDGSSDVYVVPATGGEPRRLTWYPARDNTDRMGFDNVVLGWTPDGRILFRSQRGPMGGFTGEPWAVRPEGGPVERYPIAEAGHVSFSPDGRRAAVTRIFRDFRQWKRYQGGMAQDVWLYDLASHAVEKITDWRGMDTQPMWLGGAVYFLSDRDGWKANLWRYDLASRASTRVTSFTEFDCKWAHAGADRLVFENGGLLWLLDPKDGQARQVRVTLPDEARAARTRWVKVEEQITDASLAPDGKRVAFTARGDVFTVPAEHGDVRNVTRSSGVRERNATWSPDGKWLAYFSDATGEEELYVQAQDGRSAPVKLTSGPPTWHFPPVWSPDSSRLAWSDRGLRLWWVSLADQVPVLAHTALHREIPEYAWSPDSRWLAFATETAVETQAVFLHSLDTRVSTQATADGYDSGEPVFDPEGKHLFVLSARDVAPTLGNLESSYTVNKMLRPHAITLRADLPSPFAPRSDEVKVGEAEARPEEKKGEGKAEKKPAPPVRIDLAGLAQRIVPFPVAPGNYEGLQLAKGKVTWRSLPTTELTAPGPRKGALKSFDLEKRKETELLPAVERHQVSADGTRLLYKADKVWAIAELKEGLKAGDGALKLDGLRLELDPRAEWAQIYLETWRLFRDFFYLPDQGQVDWPAMRERYRPLLAHVTHRYDLNYVLGELVAELATGHTYVGGGDMARPERVPVGTLGADLTLDAAAGRWRIGRILPAQPWIEGRATPLAAPGVKVAEGDYLLAIDGRELTGRDEPYRLLAQTPGRTVTLTVNGAPTAKGAREVSVQPLPNEWDLRYFDWVETNRQKVEQASGGRIGYLHIPDMGGRGLTEFIRQFYAQSAKAGLVVDVRANGGGFVSQMILERLRRRLMGMSNMRGQKPFTYPNAAVSGPMAAIANQYSASDGDIFPHFFRAYGLGPVVGQRTWGGVVGIRGTYSGMVDGGYSNVAEFGMYDLQRRWIIENEGVAPDLEVDNLPADLVAGRDPQLERAVEEVLKQIAAQPPGRPGPPPSKDLRDPQPPRR